MEVAWKRWTQTLAFAGIGLLASTGLVRGQHFGDCIQHVENATVIVPASVQASVGDATLEEGDEIALFTDDGTCAGYGTWDGDNLSIAAAGAGDPEPSGFDAGEPLNYRVWDASGEQVYVGEATYASCDDENPLCRDDGTYEHNVLFRLAALQADAPLPVELVALEATVDGEATVLKWTTASETDNAGFEVQHQGPEVTDDTWRRVGFVEGQGTTSTPQTYSYRLKDLYPGTHRFRLKQVDLDGTTEFTEVVEADIELAGTYDIVAPYPNPFRQRATFALTVAEEQRVEVVAYNQLGQRVATLHSGSLRPNTTHTFRLDGSRLSSGTYFVRVQGEAFSATRRATLVR